MSRIFILAALITFILPAVSFSNDEATLKKLKSQIQQQEKAIKSMQSSKTNLAKQIETLEKNRSDIKYAATLTSNQIQKNTARINELQKQERELNQKSAQYRSQAKTALVFLMDNSGTLTARALFGGSSGENEDTAVRDPATTAAVMEIIDRLNVQLLDRVHQYNIAVQDITKVKADITATNARLEEDRKQNEKLANDLRNSTSELTKKMTQLKNDEKAQKAHLANLKAEQDKLTKAIAQRKQQMAASGFANEKGRLPYPVPGRIIDHFGEKLVPEAGIKVMNRLVKIRPTGSGEVKSVYAGKVIYINRLGISGNTVIVQHDNTFYTAYSNLDDFYVSNMQSVEKNTPLGRINVDLKDDSSYLSFGVYRNQVAQNPADWLQK